MGKLMDLFTRKDPKVVEFEGAIVPVEILAIAKEVDEFDQALLAIENDIQRENAGKALVDIRRRRKQIEKCLEKDIKEANQRHKTLTKVRSMFTSRLKAQEELLTKAMNAYDTRKEAEAAQAQEAMAADETAPAVVLAATVPKVDGLSSKQDYEAVVEDEALVPIAFAGVLLRPIDMSALHKLAKLANGAPSQIPGVRFQPKKVYSVHGPGMALSHYAEGGILD